MMMIMKMVVNSTNVTLTMMTMIKIMIATMAIMLMMMMVSFCMAKVTTNKKWALANQHQMSSLQGRLLSTSGTQQHDTHQQCVVINLSNFLVFGFVWLQKCRSQKGRPGFVAKVYKAAGSARQSQQPVPAAMKRSDNAIPAIWILCHFATHIHVSVTKEKQFRSR